MAKKSSSSKGTNDKRYHNEKELSEARHAHLAASERHLVARRQRDSHHRWRQRHRHRIWWRRQRTRTRPREWRLGRHLGVTDVAATANDRGCAQAHPLFAFLLPSAMLQRVKRRPGANSSCIRGSEFPKGCRREQKTMESVVSAIINLAMIERLNHKSQKGDRR